MRFGIGWRPELAVGIVANLDRIDVIEILAEDFVHASAQQKRAVRFLGTLVPVVVHATSLGLASAVPVDAKRLDAVARVIDWIEPEFWSEHLSFVRAGGAEIGHLAAPPRNAETLEGLERNVRLAATATGSMPLLENVATLVDPPLSTLTEEEWLQVVPAETGCRLLLDLHNLHANAVNFGFDARAVVRRLDRVGAVHLAGGRKIDGGRILDDHRHAVPDPVYSLLRDVAASDAVVILERDGNYPAIDVLMSEIARARNEVAVPPPARPLPVEVPVEAGGAGAAVLAFLATLYTNDTARLRFRADPDGEARAAGLPPDVASRVAAIDLQNLELAAQSFARKRAGSEYR